MTAETPNAAQADFWNGLPGEMWVARQEDLDHISRHVGAALRDVADPQQGQAVLDIGCGAGATSFDFADAVGPGGSVLGVDISAPLLARAETRRKSLGLTNVAFERADAQTYPFRPDSFDLAVSRFGVMFFADPVAAFANIGHALRPGGRLVFAAWQGPESNPWFTLPEKVAEDHFGAEPPGDPTAPGPMAFRDADRVLDLLTRAGLRCANVDARQVDLYHPGGVKAAVTLASIVGPLGRMLRLRGNTEADRAAILPDLHAALAPYEKPDGFRIPSGIFIYSAQRAT